MRDDNDFSGLEKFAGVVRVDDGQLKSHVDTVVRESVEQTLNALLDAEADVLCGAKRYERNPERQDTRAGHYERRLHT
jgi:putative transposase